MFCPVCRSEYREGVRSCPDCGVDLVAELIEERRPEAALVPLLSTHDSADIAMIRSILEDSRIRYHIQGENALHIARDAEPAVLFVASDDLEAAGELLADLDPSPTTVFFHRHDPRSGG